MSLPAPPCCARSSPLSRQRGLDSGCGPASHNSGGNGPTAKTHKTTRSASRGNRVSTKPRGSAHRHQPATAGAGNQPDPGRDLGSPGGQQRQGQLSEHPCHHPPHPARSCHCINYLRNRPAETPATRRKNAEKRAISPGQGRGRGPQSHPVSEPPCQES